MDTVNLSTEASNGTASPNELDVYNVHPRATWSAVVILTISVIGNSLLVAAFIRDRRLRVVFNTLVLTLALADILISLILVLEIISLSFRHPIFAESALLCRFLSIVVNAVPTEQLIISHMMCNDRHKAFLRRLAYCHVRQQYNESMRLAVTWAFSLTASFLITDIMIILEHGQFSLCFFPDRPLYVSKMAYIHSFLLALLIISLLYIVRDFRKQRNKKPYFTCLGPDVEPGLENYLDNRTSSQCLIPRSPVNIFRNSHLSLSPKAFHQFIQTDDKIISGDGKPKAAPQVDLTTFNFGKTSPTESADKLVAEKDLLDWQEQNVPDKLDRDERITHYTNFSSEAMVVGNTCPEDEEDKLEQTVNLKNIVRNSRAEKRLMMRRNAIFERCSSETRKIMRILELNMERNDAIKSSDHVSRVGDKTEVEASSNSQDEWSHSSCSFSEEEPTDIPVPRFKPRTDSMYTLRSCVSISEEATNFETIYMAGSPVHTGDIIDVRYAKTERADNQFMLQTKTEHTKNTFDTLKETFSQDGDVISGMNVGKDEQRDLMNFDSPVQCEVNTESVDERCPEVDFFQKNDKDVNEDLIRFSSTKTISAVNPDEASRCSELTLQPADVERFTTSPTQRKADDKCNNYYGSECESKSNDGLDSGNNFTLNVSQKKQVSRVSSDEVEKSVRSDQRTYAKNDESTSPHHSPIDIDVAVRDWITFYNVRRQSSESVGESLDSFQANTSTSLTCSSNQRTYSMKISGEEMTSTSPENKGAHFMNFDMDEKCNPLSTECTPLKCEEVTSKVEGSGDNLTKSSPAGENLLQQVYIGDTVGRSILSSSCVEDKVTASTEERTSDFYTVVPTDSTALTPTGTLISWPEDERESTAFQLGQETKEDHWRERNNKCDQLDTVSADVQGDDMNIMDRNTDLSDSYQHIQEETTKPVNHTCTSHVMKSNDMFDRSDPDVCHREDKNDQGQISIDRFEMKSEHCEGRQLKEALFTSPAVSHTSMSPLELLDSLSVTRRAYLAEIGLYQDVLAGEVRLDPSLLQKDQCPPCPYCMEKEKTYVDSDEPSEISSSEASSMTEFTLGDVDRMASRSLLSESRHRHLKFLADSSSNNLTPSEHVRSNFSSFYLRRSPESPSWCETSPVFTTDMSDHFNFRRHDKITDYFTYRNKVYNTWSPHLKKIKKYLSFEIIKSYDPELSILVSLLLLTLLQLICWLPITSLYVYFNFHNFPHKMEVQEIHYILLWLARMALQPFIYIYYSKCFRMNFIYFLSCGFYNYRK